MTKLRSQLSQKSISAMNDDLNKSKELGINLDPPHQRGEVWTEEEQMCCIESIIKGIIINPIIMNWNTNDATRTCIDGKQRCTSIMKFMSNQIPYKVSNTDEYYFFGPHDDNII